MGLLKGFDPEIDSDQAGLNESGVPPDKQVRVVVTPSGSQPFPDFDRAVDDAMCLLLYAAETGRIVDDATRGAVLRARAAASPRADEIMAANLLAALTKLAADSHPVTAESLRASCDRQTKPTIKRLRVWTWVLAVLIILSSALAFISSSLSSTIRADITTANDLVVKLRSELGTKNVPTGGTPEKPELPTGLNQGDVITQLQQYATTIRAIDARARQLNWFVLKAEWDPFSQLRWSPTQSPENLRKLKDKFQLTVGLPNMLGDLDNLTSTYQDVRSFAQDILDRVSVSYGALTTCLLPVLYSLLGACACLLRCFEEEVKNKTFTPSSRATSARLLVAVIGGTVVGLFGNFSFTQGASISPLAIAFLVGYAVDVFFSFLESLLQVFTKSRNSGFVAKAAPSN
jgi:hypothetical protein